MDTKKYVDTNWRELRQAINKAYANAANLSGEQREDAECLRDYAENISWSDDLAALLGRESANERQHRSNRPSIKGFSIETAAKLIIMDNVAKGARQDGMPRATAFLVLRQTAVEAQVIGAICGPFLHDSWIAAVQALDYSELMKTE